MTAPPPRNQPATEGLRRILGLGRGLALTLGVVVGAGIFVLPAYVAPLLPGPAWFLGIWAIAGFVALCTAISYAELATLYPHTGGYVVYLREIYGDRMAFVYGWAALLVLYPSGIASVAATFAQAFLHLWPLALDPRVPAMTLVLAALGLQLSGVEPSSRTQVALTGVKVVALTGLAVAGLTVTGAAQAPQAPAPVVEETVPLADSFTWGGFFLAFVIASWCFDGFLEIVVVAGEVQRPTRVLWRVLVATVLVATLLYLLFAGALLRQLGLTGIATSSSVAADLSGRLLGRGGAVAVDLLVMLATGSGLVAVLYSGPRLLVALARAGLFFEFAAWVSPRTGTPPGAVLAMGAVALAYAAAGTLGELVKYFSVTTALFSLLILAGGVWLRVRGCVPSDLRRVPVWPLPPMVAVLAATGGIIHVLRDQPRSSVAGLALMALAVPVAGWVLPRLRRGP